LGLVSGPLLPGFSEDWITPQLLQLEEEQAQATVELMRALTDLGDPQRAILMGKRALAVSPLREDVHVELIRAFASNGQKGEAIRQFEELEQLLDDHFGESPSDEAERALDEVPRAAPREVPVRESQKPARAKLPVQLTRFFGREEELALLSESLPPGRARLTTITGLGGCGKTRLAHRLAEAMAKAYSGRVWFVPLADLRDPNLLAPSVLTVMGIRSETADPVDSLVGALGEEPALLILDNVEHLLPEAADFVHELLARASGLTVLTTSRAPTEVAGERRFPIKPLPLPAEGTTVATLLENPSVALFVDRAQAVRPEFKVDASNAQAVRELCFRLEGLPLALELAAGRTTSMSAAQILGRLATDLGFLASTHRSSPERQRTLAATIQWSYDLLPGPLQLVCDRLSVFRGSFTLEAAARIARASHDDLAELIDCSLLFLESADDRERYRLAEAVREFAAARFGSHPEAEEVLSRHLDFYAELTADLAERMKGPHQLQALIDLDHEHDNLRKAVQWCAQHDPFPAAGYRLIANLRMYVWMRGHTAEWIAHGTGALRAPHDPDSDRERAACMATVGTFFYGRSDYEQAIQHYEEAHRLFRQNGDDFGAAQALFNKVQALGYTEPGLDAIAQYEEAVRATEATGDENLLLRTLTSFAWFLERNEEYDRARSVYKMALPLAERGDARSLATIQDAMGRLQLWAGDASGALQLHLEALETNERLGNRRGISANLANISLAHKALGNLSEALKYRIQALEHDWRLRDLREVRLSLNHVAGLLAVLGKAEMGAELIGLADVLGERHDFVLPMAEEREREESLASIEAAIGAERLASLALLGSGRPMEKSILKLLATHGEGFAWEEPTVMEVD
jgi:predicted ATPase